MSQNGWYFGIFALCLLLSAFFSSAEAAVLSAHRVRMRHLVSQGVAAARRVAPLVEHPHRVLPSILLGNNLVNTAAATFGTLLAISFLGAERGPLVATLAVAALLVVAGEAVPKAVAVRHSDRLTLLYARPLQWTQRLLFPFAAVLRGISQLAVSLFGGGDTRAVVIEEEIKLLISLGREEGVVESEAAVMLARVFRFRDRRVREVMTPRTEVVWVEQGMPLREFLQLYGQHFHTRFPVYQGTLDNVVGVLSVKDVVRVLGRGALDPEALVTGVVRPAYFVPETKLISDLFRELRQSGHQMAMVVDEFGGISGLVTLKRLIEEVVGPVGEEGREAREEYQVLAENTFKLDGGMLVEEANEKMGLNLPLGEYETVAGFVLEYLGHIPVEGEVFHYNGLRIAVTQMQGVKIETLTVTRLVREARRW